MIYRTKAPLRISFCGGGTDVSPYTEERGGVVLSATIDKYAYASLEPIEEPVARVTSLDFGITRTYPLGRRLETDGELDLVKGALNRFQEDGAFPSGLAVFLRTDAPPGSGLGSSSTMVTTLVGVLAEWLHRPLTPYEMAELTYRIERVDLRIAGGRQDQYAAVFGGFNFMEFHADHTVVNPLRLRRGTVNELEVSLLLCFTGTTRLGAHIVERQAQAYVDGQAAVISSLDEMKRLTLEMKALLLRDRLREFGDRLHEAWEWKKQLEPGISTPFIDRLYERARGEGALGGKILGAGGGGFLLVMAAFEKRHLVAKALEEEGGVIVPFSFEGSGLQAWTVTP
jgi:D-glycero-alpha-D-manno-heptose-7-phosphate kinase